MMMVVMGNGLHKRLIWGDAHCLGRQTHGKGCASFDLLDATVHDETAT